jgi:hypothetical protein
MKFYIPIMVVRIWSLSKKMNFKISNKFLSVFSYKLLVYFIVNASLFSLLIKSESPFQNTSDIW